MHFSFFIYYDKEKINSSSESMNYIINVLTQLFLLKYFFKYTKKRIYIILNERKKGKKLMKKIFLK